MRAERRAGELLAGMEKNCGARGVGKKVESHDATPLSSLGIDKSQSSRWQKVSSLKDSIFEGFIADSKGGVRTSPRLCS